MNVNHFLMPIRSSFEVTIQLQRKVYGNIYTHTHTYICTLSLPFMVYFSCLFLPMLLLTPSEAGEHRKLGEETEMSNQKGGREDLRLVFCYMKIICCRVGDQIERLK